MYYIIIIIIIIIKREVKIFEKLEKGEEVI